MAQDVANIVLTMFAGLSGFFLTSFWQSVKDLERTDKDINKRISESENIAVDRYISRAEIESTLGEIMLRLNRIEEKLDSKADKRRTI